MVGKTAPIRPNDRERMETIRFHCGCLACLLMGHLDRHTTIEHVTQTGRRVGGKEQHQNTIGLCGWHHFGHVDPGVLTDTMRPAFGPSLMDGRHVFEEHFGDEVDVLIPAQNYILELFAENPWPEYNLPRDVARKTRTRWIELKHET